MLKLSDNLWNYLAFKVFVATEVSMPDDTIQP